jgi:hypothetical protein
MPAQEAERQRRVAKAIARFDSFCGLLQIRPKSASETIADAKRIQMVLTPLQRKYNATRTSRDIVLKPRQVFFTTLEGARDVWWFLTKPGAHVIVVCQSQTDLAALKDISEKFRIFFDSLQRLGLKLDFGRESGTEWTLPKRDATLRIIQAGASEVAAQRKGRGGTVNRLHLSEMAFWGEYAKDTFLSLTESVPKDGSEIVNESTANGAGGFYHEQWRAAVDGISAYRPHFVAWYDHPEYTLPLDDGETFDPRDKKESGMLANGVRPDQLKWRRWKIADKGGNKDAVAQEYPDDPETCFLVGGRNFFDIEKVEGQIAVAALPRVIDASLRVWADPVDGRQYVIGADPAGGGTDADASSATVLERGTGRHVATLHGYWSPWDFAGKLAALGSLYNNACLAVERENHGTAVLQALDRDCKYGNIYSQTRDDGAAAGHRPGWLTNAATRAPMLDAFDAAHRRDIFVTNDVDLLGEMRTFIINDKGKAEGKPGTHDDRVMATGIAWAVATQPTGYQGALPGVIKMVTPTRGW